MPRPTKRKVWAIDCETDPFLYGRVPEPFVWGAYDGQEFLIFDDTKAFALWAADNHAILYAHNGGKFDFIFLLPFLDLVTDSKCTVKIIHSRIVAMRFGKAELRDSWSIIPIKLADYQKQEIEYWKLERESRKEHQQEIEQYLKSDCVNLWNLVDTYRSQAGKGYTIAGNAMTFAKKNCEIDVGKTNHKFDDKFRPFYYGGRCQCLQPGRHENARLYDINSAYPFAMTHDHATGTDYIERPNWTRLSVDRLQRCFFTIECPRPNGAFPLRTKYALDFPIKSDATFRITGWEFITALKHDLIGKDGRDFQVLKCTEFYDTINFKPYVTHWFDHKSKADKRGDKANRIVGKIMLNSLYGKLCQNPVTYKDYKIVPIGTARESGWHIEAEIGTMELHSRPTLYTLIERYGDDWQKFSIHYNVATGASITGFTRAQLLDAICTLGFSQSLYVDTDCILVDPRAVVDRLATNHDLGGWTLEGTASPAILAGKKLYALRLNMGDQQIDKVVCKGGSLNFSQIERLIDGEKIRWQNPAPTFGLDGEADFVVRNFVATA